MFLFY